MDITYLGVSSFKIKGKSVSLVTDPFDPEFTGIKFPKVEAEVVTVSHPHPDHNFVSGIEGVPFIISEQGEYEIKGVSVFGFSSFHDAQAGRERGENIIYLIEIDGMRICHLGDLGCLPSDRILEEIGSPDVLMVPVGGAVTLDADGAEEFIKKIEPLIVLPMHYKTSGMNERVYADLQPAEKFLSKIGTENPEKLDKLSLSKDKLPKEMKVILLEKRN